MSTTFPCSQIINSYYVVDHLGYPSRQNTISLVQKQLANDGCAVIRNFLSHDGLNILLLEAEERLEHAYYFSKKLCNLVSR